jgi:hypothetical protein
MLWPGFERVRVCRSGSQKSIRLSGAAEGIRTPDPRITNAVLYRLSYRGIKDLGPAPTRIATGLPPEIADFVLSP